MHFAHATCLVTRPETREHGAWLREFWLTTERGDWVEVDFEQPAGPRTRPSRRPRVLVTRGKLGELLAQEFLGDYANASDLLAMQARLDALRASADATAWSEERRGAIGAAERALEDAFYATAFPLPVTLVVLSRTFRDALTRDFDALRLPLGRLLDRCVEPDGIVTPNEQVSL